MIRQLLLGLVTIGLAVTPALAQRGYNLSVPDRTLPVPPMPPPNPPGAAAPAPVPNRDLEFSGDKTTGNTPSVAPSLFTRGDAYRGEGFNKGSTAQSEQDKRARPAAGFNLKVPLTPN